MADVLVTGAAGFIGYHVSKRLLDAGQSVAGFDNLNNYYDVSLKEARLKNLTAYPNFRFEKGDLSDKAAVDRVFANERPPKVIHLAAQAGVRYSLTNPHAYTSSNLVGFVNILEACRYNKVKHLVYASSSSVYGGNTKMPFSVHDNVDHPLSLYAATKKANELLAHSYSNLFALPVTGLRFFTVYGPWGRPDMALFIFTKAIVSGQPIDVFNNGQMKRDFTYIDDIVEGVVRISDVIPQPDPNWNGEEPDPSSSKAPYRLYNIGNHNPIDLMDMIGLLEKHLGRTAQKRFLPMQPGDVPATYADVQALTDATGFAPATPMSDGIARFVRWYLEYYGVDEPVKQTRVRQANS